MWLSGIGVAATSLIVFAFVNDLKAEKDEVGDSSS